MAEDELLEAYINVYLSAFKYVSELVSGSSKQYHISFEQFLIMREVMAGADVAISDVARARHVSRAAISRQLKTLLDLGYVTQERANNDRRRQYLRLTQKGTTITKAISTAMHKRFHGWVDVIGEQDARELLRIMTRVGDELIDK